MRPTLRRALDTLLEARSRAIEAGAPRLAGMKQLALAAGVSVPTMCAAVAQCRRDGLVRTVRGSGIYVCRPGEQMQPEPDIPRAPPAKDELAGRQLRADILNGVYAPGEKLPAVKTLCDRLGISYRPLRRALAALVSEGYLSRAARGYRASSPRTSGGDNVLVLTIRGFPDAHPRPSTPWLRPLIGMLEQECCRAALRLEIAPVILTDSPPGVRCRLFDTRHGRRLCSSAFGFCHLEVGLPQRFNELIVDRILTMSSSPVASLAVQAEPSELPRGIHSSERLCRLTPALGEECGLAVGRYLLTRGHRHVAYFSAEHHETWSQRRLSGIRRAFAEAGCEGTVRAYTTAPEGRPLPQRFRTARMRELRRLSRLFDSVNDPEVVDPRRRLLAERFRIPLREAFEAKWARERLTPMMAQAMSDAQITAWVGSNQTAALLCMEFLQAHSVAVPARIGVVAFDDDEELLAAGVTSYNFNPRAIVNMMLRHVLAGSSRQRRDRQSLTTVDGFIVQRRSVAHRASSAN